jgi:hypothetical protein
VHSLPRLGLLVSLCLLVGLAVSGWSQIGPDEQLYWQARRAMRQQDYPVVMTACERLRKEFPQSRFAPDVTVLLLQTSYLTNAPANLAPLWDEIFARWPGTEYAWQAVDISFTALVAKDPEKTLQWLADISQQGKLPADAPYRAFDLRMTYIKKTNPDQLLAEGVPFVTAALQDGTPPMQLRWAAKVAGYLYPTLMQGKRFDDARTIAMQLENRLVASGLGMDPINQDLLSYFGALAQADPERYVTEILPVMAWVKYARIRKEMEFHLAHNIPCYTTLFRQGKVQEAHQVLEQINTALQRLKLDGDLFKNVREFYYAANMGGQAKVTTAEVPAWLKTVPEHLTPQHSAEVVSLADLTYVALLSTGATPEQFNAFHAQVQQVLTRPEAQVAYAWQDTLRYCTHIRSNRQPLTATDGMAFVPLLDQVATASEAALPVGAARDTYPVLMRQGQLPAARTLHEKVLTTLRRVGTTEQLLADEQAFFTALAEIVPDTFLTEGWTYLQQRQERAASASEARAVVGVAQLLYLPLMQKQRMDDAQALHARVAELCMKFEGLQADAKADDLAFTNALATARPTDYLAKITPLLKNAAATRQPEDIRLVVETVRVAYAPLIRNGLLETACDLHQQVQTLLKDTDSPQGWRDADDKAFQGSISSETIGAMVMMAKLAVATNDLPTARTWLTTLEALAPQDPRTVELQRLVPQP